MFPRLLIALGLLALAGCVTTPDYRYVNTADGYYSGANGGAGYYTDDGYYGSSAGYYAGYGVYPTATWGFSPWYGYAGRGYASHAGWGLGFGNYGSWGFSPGWGGYWGGFGYSPFFASYFPYWYYNSYARHSDHNRRDMRAVRAEQLRQADYQRSLNRVPPRGGIRMWAPPRHSVARDGGAARADVRSETRRQAALQSAPARSTPRTSVNPFRDTTPAAATPSHYQMPRGVPASRDIQVRPSRSINTPTHSMPMPRSVPQPRAAPSAPMRSMPRSIPVPQPTFDGGRGHERHSHRESRQR